MTNNNGLHSEKIKISGIDIEWDLFHGTCTFSGLPVTMMWVDTTLTGLMSGLHSMVGTKRFGLALQNEGRKSVADDWTVISRFSDFHEGFKAIANIAAVAGWGEWSILDLNPDKKECQIRVANSWEGLYQKKCQSAFNIDPLSASKNDPPKVKKYYQLTA